MAPPVDSPRGTPPADAGADWAERVAALRPSTDLVQRDMFAQVAAGLFGSAPAPVRLGRYTLVSRRGAGGMGTVFVAWDHALQRRIALKVLHRGQPDRQDAILREAHALARLAHPNVVPIYDVGREGDDAFIAMALVDGAEIGLVVRRTLPTPEQLARWLADAASGLAAAHTAGLVHGDVKPQNLLVGDDGHPRWIDFGLAAVLGDEQIRGGTRGYLAPEITAGGPCSAAADVFAMCVTAIELRAAADEGSWSGSLGRLLARGCADDPARRCTMADLAAAFASASRRRLSRGLAAATLAAGLVALALTTTATGAAACELPVGAAWHDGARARTERALARLGAEGEAVWASVQDELEARAAAWLLARDRACAMPSIERRPIAACLVDHHVALEAAVEQLETAAAAPRADQVVDAVGDPAACRDASAVTTTDDAELRRARVRVEVAESLGDFPGALALAVEYEGVARREGDPKARVEAEIGLGRLQTHMGAAATGVAHLQDAYYRAVEIGDDRLAATAATEVLRATAGPLGDTRRAEQWRRPVMVALERADAPIAMHVRAIEALASLADDAGDAATTHDLVAKLFAEHADALEADPVAKMAAHMLYAGALRKLGDPNGQLVQRQAALEIAERLRPPGHPDIGVALAALGSAWDDLGEYERAEQMLVRGIAVLERTDLHDRLGNAQYDLGRVYANLGDPVRARAQYEAAARTIATYRGATHQDSVLPLVGLAEVAATAGDHDTALSHYERALALASTESDRGYLHFALAELAIAGGQWTRALESIDRARALVGDDKAARLMRAELWFAEGRARAGLGERDRARAAFGECLALAEAPPLLADFPEAVATELARLDGAAAR